MRSLTAIIALFSALFLFSCSSEVDDFDVAYKITFDGYWSAATHPTDFPGDAHFSPMIGMSHNSDTILFAQGALASEGIKVMAETGATNPLDEEINGIISKNKALDLFVGESFDAPGENNVEFGVDESNSRVSVVSMIAPGPDWFVGARDVNLFENGEWLDFKTVQVKAYDAGTDDGTTFTSENAATDPPFGITMIVNPPLAEEGALESMGVFIFERIK